MVVPVPELTGAASVLVAGAVVLGGLVLSAEGVHTSKVISQAGDCLPQVLEGGHFQSLPPALHSTEGPGASPQVGVWGS